MTTARSRRQGVITSITIVIDVQAGTLFQEIPQLTTENNVVHFV